MTCLTRYAAQSEREQPSSHHRTEERAAQRTSSRSHEMLYSRRPRFSVTCTTSGASARRRLQGRDYSRTFIRTLGVPTLQEQFSEHIIRMCEGIFSSGVNSFVRSRWVTTAPGIFGSRSGAKRFPDPTSGRKKLLLAYSCTTACCFIVVFRNAG